MKFSFSAVIYWLIIIGCTLFTAYDVSTERTQYNADIRAALPATNHSELARADHDFSSQAVRQGIISVKAGSDPTLLSTLRLYLHEHHFSLQDQNNGHLQELARFYAHYSPLILSPDFAQAIQSTASYGDFFYTRLAETASPFISASIAFDPTLNTAALLSYLIHQTALFSLQGNNLVLDGNKGRRIFLFFEYEGLENQEVESFNTLASRLAQWRNDYPQSDILYSGAPFHNAENTELAKREMGLFSTLSIVILVLVMGLTFRNLYTFLYVHLSVLAAVIAGFAALLLVFPTVHVLALVFGITLIGIAVDYTLHIIAHQQPLQNPNTREIKTAITLGFITTTMGYCSFILTGVSMLTQVAVFVIAGLTAAWGFAMWIVPVTATPTFKQSLLYRYSQGKNPAFLMHYPKVILSACTLVLVLFVVYLQPKFVQSPAVLNASSSMLKQQEATHYHYLFANQQRYLVHASSLQAYLEKEARIIKQIQIPYPDARFDAISQWLPPISAQLQNRQKWQHAIDTGIFTLVSEWVSSPIPTPPAAPLTADEFKKMPFGKLYESHIIEQPDGVTGWFAVTLQPENGDDVPIDSIDAIPYDKARMLTQSMGDLIHHVTVIACITLAIICFVIFYRYGFGSALMSLVVLFNIVGGALVISYVIDSMLTLFHLLAVMLILALAADYLIFYLSQGRKPNTQFAIILSGITSLSVFGVLIFSQTPAIHQVGLTVLTGVLLTLILTPLVTEEFT
ncbi:MMPL family transporter [Alteromonas sp. 14N.309.X.WAT.G.H12]|uniref:MMPL family transporter n=1 Tax=Alteromonas sp. 14N.309.X.WAT.G.H12 TaxID=3120824 RepID=UPI002FD4A3D3